jgi:hypothetical protein
MGSALKAVESVGETAAEVINPFNDVGGVVDGIAGKDSMDKFYSTADHDLANGGQTGLDLLGMIPGVGAGIEFGEEAYHGMHSEHDRLEGDTKGAAEEEGASVWHGAMGAANALGGDDAGLDKETQTAVHQAEHAATVVETDYDAATNLRNSQTDDKKPGGGYENEKDTPGWAETIGSAAKWFMV